MRETWKNDGLTKIIICKHSWRAAFIVFFASGACRDAGLEIMALALEGLRALFQKKRQRFIRIRSSKEGCAKCLLSDT